MGKRGPPPTPTKTLAIRGSWRAKVRENEPTPKPECPICPKWLSDEGKVVWKYLAPRLFGMGILTKVDRNALARYCDYCARFEEAVAFLAEHKSVYPVRNTADEIVEFKQFPQVGIASKLGELLAKLEREFGLTPSARANMATVKSPKEKDEDGNGKARFFQPTERSG